MWKYRAAILIWLAFIAVVFVAFTAIGTYFGWDTVDRIGSALFIGIAIMGVLGVLLSLSGKDN